MVREIKASPLLFGYRGSELVDVEAVERLLRRVAQLQHDLPQVRALAAAAGAGRRRRARPCSARPSGSSRSKDPRSDWFVRRLSTMPGDTHPRLTAATDGAA